MTSVFGAFRCGFRTLLGAALGLGAGATLGFYTQSLFGPLLIEEFGWSKARFALVGMMALGNPL